MSNCEYVAITNIPNDFHVSDLRTHFSTFVENGSFICFHYRHRPEKVDKEKEAETAGNSSLKSKSKSKSKFSCVVVKMHRSRFNDFLQKYNNEQWTDASSNYLIHMCNISSIKITRDKVDTEGENSGDYVLEEKLLAMPELKPPDLMPNGNVGTPTSVFLDYIQRCLLPDRLIQTLKLKFPKTEGKRIYSNVNYQYDEHKKDTGLKRKCSKFKLLKRNSTQNQCLDTEPNIDMVTKKCKNDNIDNIATDTADGRTKICVESSTLNSMSSDSSKHIPSKRELKKLKKMQRKERVAMMSENIEEHLISVEKKYHNDEDAEEWDRHEAMDDDPSNQERNKERLYEEEIEQPWEKGGPGVVFYTDAMFWQAREGDFDEQTTDDLDVDFSPYEGNGPGDKDIRDFLKIRQEQRFRSGYDKTDRFSIGLSKKPVIDNRPKSMSNLSLPGPSFLKQPTNQTIGQFESHTKGVGRKILEKQGWKDGQGLGKSQSGIKQALKGEGQKSRAKKGLGFVKPDPVVYGTPFVKKAKTAKGHIITSALDNPHETDPKEKLLQTQEPRTLKHRQSFVDHFSAGN